MARNTRVALIVPFAALLLSACGGGGGSPSNSTPPPPPPPPTATVTGVAAKGLLLNAPVSFFAVNNGAIGTSAIATTRTDGTTGQFSSSVTSAGPVVAVVTTDASTMMLDELSGVANAAPSGLVLHAVVNSVENLQALSVTPLTEMAYELAASANGGLSSANIDAANSAVSQAFLNGSSILSTAPIPLSDFLTASVAEQAQAKLLTALAVAANEGTATDASGTPCTGTYDSKLVCLIGGLAKLATLNADGAATLTANAGYVAAAYAALDSGAVTVQGGQDPAALGLNTVTSAETAFVTAFAHSNPLPGYTASGNILADTKALIANIRNNILDQATTQTFAYAPTLNALGDDYAANLGPVTQNTANLVGDLIAAEDLLRQGVVSYEGNCGYDPVTLGTDNQTVLCAYQMPGAGGTTSGGRILLTVTVDGAYPFTGAAHAFAIQTQPLVPYGSLCTASFNPVTNGCPVNTSYPPVSAQVAWDIPTNQGSLVGPFYVTGSGGQIASNIQLSVSNWDSTTRSGTVALSGSLSSGTGGVALVSAEISPDTVLQVSNLSRLNDGSALFAIGLPPISVTGTVDFASITTSDFIYALKIVLGALAADKSGAAAVPGSVTMTASVKQLVGGTVTNLFDGSVTVALVGLASYDATQPVSADNYYTVQTDISGQVTLPSGRLLSVSAAANASQQVPTQAHPLSFSATYTYVTPAGTAELNATGQYDTVDGMSGTITNNAGITVVVADPIGGPLTGTITASGTQTATIVGAFVFYSDGTSESLF